MSRKRIHCIISLILILTTLNPIPDVLGQDEPEPFFSVTLIGLVAGSGLQYIYYEKVQQDLEKFGIEAELDLASWAGMGTRVWDEEVSGYKEGGYDMAFSGLSIGGVMDSLGRGLELLYGKASIPPAGYNLMYWNTTEGLNYITYRAQESNELIDQINAEMNYTNSKEAAIEWQKLWYDVMPHLVIDNDLDFHMIANTINGYDPIQGPATSLKQLSGETQIKIDSFGLPEYNTIFASSHSGIPFHRCVAEAPQIQLFQFSPSKLTHFSPQINQSAWMQFNFRTSSHLKLCPLLTTSMGSFSEETLQYNLTLKDTIYFHDGHRLYG